MEASLAFIQKSSRFSSKVVEVEVWNFQEHYSHVLPPHFALLRLTFCFAIDAQVFIGGRQFDVMEDGSISVAPIASQPLMPA